jgi:V/A-type H+-transporting ATPase subunit D
MDHLTPSRSALLELGDERRAMREGHGFLDEKCLLLAGEMLVELRRDRERSAALRAAHETALAALAAAVARHGLDALQVAPAAGLAADVVLRNRRLMGVPLCEASLAPADEASPPAAEPFEASPEASACREAFRRLAAASAPYAASRGNLERLAAEYDRASRRARALANVLIPEADRRIAELDNRLAELEQEDAIQRRPRRR